MSAHDGTVAVRRGEELDVAALSAWLAQNVSDFGTADGPPLAVTQFPGGHSNLTYLLKRGTERLVLRRPPFGSPVKGAHDMEREYRVLSRLAGHYAPAPRVYALCTDDAILNATFYVMEHVEGTILRRSASLPGEGLSEEAARLRSGQLIDGLAELHALDIDALELADLGRPVGYAERQVEGWNRRWLDARTDEVPDIDTAFAWIRAQDCSDLALEGASLLHNDFKYDNLVFHADDGPIRAVLDWEMATVGASILDLGTTLAYWIDPDDDPELHRFPSGPTTAAGGLRRSDLIERYARKSGRDVSRVLFAYVLGLLKIAVIAQQIYARYKRGLTRDERFAPLLEGVRSLGRTARRASELGRIDHLAM
jgi:aminoglycoside phosphotransferase (APT) family kinase protein